MPPGGKRKDWGQIANINKSKRLRSNAEPREGGEGSLPVAAEGSSGAAVPSPAEEAQMGPITRSPLNNATSSTKSVAGTTSSSMDIDMDLAQNDQARMGGGGSGGSSGVDAARGIAALPTGIRDPIHAGSRAFTKQYVIRIFNDSVEYRSQSGSGIQPKLKFVRWPFHDIPVELVNFYLSIDEMRWLTQFSEVRGGLCRIRVSNRTAVMPFETNSSVTTVGNNNVGVHLCQIDPTVGSLRIGHLPDPLSLLTSLHGTHLGNFPDSDKWSQTVKDLGAQFITRNYDHRFEYASLTNNYVHRDAVKPPLPTTIYEENCFPLRDFIIKRINASMNEGLFTEWEHDYSDAILFGRANNWAPSGQLKPTSEHFNKVPVSGYSKAANYLDANFAPGVFAGSNTALSDSTEPYRSFWSDVSSNWYSKYMFYNNPESHKDVPALIIGMDTLMSNTTYTSASTLVNTYIELTLDVECTVHYSNGNPRFRMFAPSGQTRIPKDNLGLLAYKLNQRSIRSYTDRNLIGNTIEWAPTGSLTLLDPELEQFELMLADEKVYKPILDHMKKSDQRTYTSLEKKLKEKKKSASNANATALEKVKVLEAEKTTLETSLGHAKRVLNTCEGRFTKEQKEIIESLNANDRKKLLATNQEENCDNYRSAYNLL